MRFVPIKTIDQQAALMLHRSRELFIGQRTQLINAMRAHLAELGLVAPTGIDGVKSLLAIIAEAGPTHQMPAPMQQALRALVAQLTAVQLQIAEMERGIQTQHRASDTSRRLESVPGRFGRYRDHGDRC